MKIVLLPNPYCDRQFACAENAYRELLSNGCEVSVCLPFGITLEGEPPQWMHLSDPDEAFHNADAMICLGGDGTILHTAKIAIEKKIPILGINVGTLGFMAELESGDLSLLSKISKGEYFTEKRMLLEVSVFSCGKTVFQEFALNDAVVTKGAIARELRLSVRSSGTDILSYSGDGVIIATPTGSTAYSFSAGGPIVEPTTECILVTPICAHAHNAGSIVLDPGREVAVYTDRSGRRNAYLSVDGGRGYRLEVGDIVRVRRAEYSIELVRLNHRNFFDTIRKKFYDR